MKFNLLYIKKTKNIMRNVDMQIHTHINTHTGTQKLDLLPAALSSGVQTEHSIPFNHMRVSQPEAGCLSLCVCLRSH